jgi:Isoleucyl-tRNA synthetase
LPADFVSDEDGTGIVHINPMHGEDDFNIAKEYNLRSEHLISPDGIFKDGDYKGLFVMDANSQIIKDLKERNILYAEELITHDYPHCWSAIHRYYIMRLRVGMF